MSVHKIRRRDFLRGALAAGAGLSVFGGVGPFMKLARAQTRPDPRHYIFCYFPGGWDVLLSLDPRDPGVFTNSNLRETRIQPGYELLPAGAQNLIETPAGLTFGPYIGELAQHAHRLAVVRGMSMDTLSHEVGMRRFLTGKPPSGLLARGSSAATWLAAHDGVDAPVPNLSIGVESYNVDQPTYATALKVQRVSDLMRAFRPEGPVFGDDVNEQLDELLRRSASCDGARASAFRRTAEGARAKSTQMALGGLDALFEFQANTPEMATLRDHYGIAPTGTAALATPQAQAALAARAIMVGVSRCVSVRITDSLDTHFDNWETDQGPRQQAGFNAVARLISDLAQQEYHDTGTSWLDHTVIVGFSEFSRTPTLNDRGGRDHWLTGTCFLTGGPVRGGRVIGASSDVGMEPQPVDLSTGALDAGGSIVRPEHVLQALFDDAGIGDAPDLRVPALSAVLQGA